MLRPRALRAEAAGSLGGAVLASMPTSRMTFVTWNAATLFYSAASIALRVVARSRAVLSMATAVALQETRGQHYDVQQLAAMHDVWIFRSSHLSGSPAGGVAIEIRAGNGGLLGTMFEVLGRVMLLLADVSGVPMFLGSIHIKPDLPTDAQVRTMQSALQVHASIPVVLGWALRSASRFGNAVHRRGGR